MKTLHLSKNEWIPIEYFSFFTIYFCSNELSHSFQFRRLWESFFFGLTGREGKIFSIQQDGFYFVY